MVQPRQGIFFPVECEEFQVDVRVNRLSGKSSSSSYAPLKKSSDGSNRSLGGSCCLGSGGGRCLEPFLGSSEEWLVSEALERQPLAVALHLLRADESEVERPDLLGVLERGGLERDDLGRNRCELVRHGRDGGHLVELLLHVVDFGGQLLEQLLHVVAAPHGHGTRLD
jgi:hypothetical protein